MITLDDFLPNFRLVEEDHVDLGVPADEAYQIVRGWDLGRSPLIRALFALRVAPDRVGRDDVPLDLRLDTLASAETGFRFLDDQPGAGFAAGAIGRFWLPQIEYRAFIPETFAAFDEPGFGKIVWAVHVAPRGTGSRVTIELRLGATDDAAWRRFRGYFRLVGPFSRLIRRSVLTQIAAELGTFERHAEHRDLAGDELISDATTQVTHCVEIAASPEEVWPWLVQMVRQHGAWHGYDRGRARRNISAPALRPMTAGELLPARVPGVRRLAVQRAEAPQVLVLEARAEAGEEQALRAATWSFTLEPLDGQHTLLLARARIDLVPQETRWPWRWLRLAGELMDPRLLHKLRDRAEGRPDRMRALSEVGEGLAGAARIAFDLITPFMRGARRHWGLDEATADRTYPGDRLIPEPRWGWTHAVTIEAPVEDVWPWVVQIGQGKAGFYSYQWLENLAGCDIHNADRVHPEWQHLEPGDRLGLHPTVQIPIVAVDAGRWFLAHGKDDLRTEKERAQGKPPRWITLTWLFLVEPLGASATRFVSRYRVAYSDDLPTRLSFGPLLVDPIGFEMDRRMLLGVKQRAEGTRRGDVQRREPPRASS